MKQTNKVNLMVMHIKLYETMWNNKMSLFFKSVMYTWLWVYVSSKDIIEANEEFLVILKKVQKI